MIGRWAIYLLYTYKSRQSSELLSSAPRPYWLCGPCAESVSSVGLQKKAQAGKPGLFATAPRPTRATHAGPDSIITCLRDWTLVLTIGTDRSKAETHSQAYDPYPGIQTLLTYGLSGPHQTKISTSLRRGSSTSDLSFPTTTSPPSPTPNNFHRMTATLKDLPLKAARQWGVNLILLDRNRAPR